MEGVLGALESTALAQYLRFARWGYAGVNVAHVLGIALLVGATVPMNLRLLGLWPSVPQQTVLRVLAPVAATGLCLAAVTGFLLFSVRAADYAAVTVFQVKLALIAAGVAAAVIAMRSHGGALDGAGRGRRAAHGALSLTCWLGALLCGRMIAFVMG